MCGIVGTTGAQDALPVLIDGLKRLEYRGYDSAGVAIVDATGRIKVAKSEGKISALEALLQTDPPKGQIGIGHTRWATHGPPTTPNAHPHVGEASRIALVHNGIIENHVTLRDELQAAGVVFASETDTEVVAQLLAREMTMLQHGNGTTPAETFVTAMRHTLARVEGSFAIAAIATDAPDVIVAARHFSPLVVGLGDGANYVASDMPALLAYTRRFLILEDGELAVVTPESVALFKLDGQPVLRTPFEVNWDAAAAEKGGYEHFVRKEIDDQPAALGETLRGRLTRQGVTLPELDTLPLENVKHCTIVAAGSSYYAGLHAKLLLERWARLPVEVAIASELRYGDPVLGPDTMVIAITQSGETADTLAALRRARDAGSPTLALTNVIGSTVTREADATLHLQVGPEIGVVATKTFTGQLVLLTLIAMAIGQRRGTLDDPTLATLAADLRRVPGLVGRAIETEEHVATVAKEMMDVRSMFYIGRGFGYPVALEGALKLKEISYVHAEGYPAGELKHGPIAMLEAAVPVFAVATPGSAYAKLLSNIEEVRARGARVVAIAAAEDERVARVADIVFEVPVMREELAPIIDVIPAQLFAYHVARARGCDVDQPRNLAKSVTVE